MEAKYNPFNPNSVVTPTLFAGRAFQVNEICKKLAQLKHNMAASFFIYGERGIGKTALAKLVNYIATAQDDKFYNLNLITSYYIAEEKQSIGSVLQESLNLLTDQMDKTLVEDIAGRLGQLVSNGKFQIGAFGTNLSLEKSLNQNLIARDITIKDQTVSILSNIIRGLKKSEDAQDGILIIIDEVHNLEDIVGAASILRNTITTLDVAGLGNVSFLLIGYKEDIQKFFSSDTSSRRTFDLKELEVMPSNEAEEVLIKGFKAAEIKYNEADLKKNINVAGGYPHSIQILGQHLIDTDNDGMIDQKDWDKVIFSTALALQDKEFSTMYTFKKKHNERDKILVALAESSKPLTKVEIKNTGTIKNIYRCISELKASGAIKEDDEGNLHLHSQLFKTAILFDLAYRRLNEYRNLNAIQDTE